MVTAVRGKKPLSHRRLQDRIRMPVDFGIDALPHRGVRVFADIDGFAERQRPGADLDQKELRKPVEAAVEIAPRGIAGPEPIARSLDPSGRDHQGAGDDTTSRRPRCRTTDRLLFLVHLSRRTAWWPLLSRHPPGTDRLTARRTPCATASTAGRCNW